MVHIPQNEIEEMILRIISNAPLAGKKNITPYIAESTKKQYARRIAKVAITEMTVPACHIVNTEGK